MTVATCDILLQICAQPAVHELVRLELDVDELFQLTGEEFEILRSQSVISRSRHGGRHIAPYAFSEQGVAMLSSVLRSPDGRGQGSQPPGVFSFSCFRAFVATPLRLMPC